MTMPVESRTQLLKQLLSERILVLDGAMGTTVFSLGIDEESIRGERFKSHHKALKNFVDIIAMTQPEALVDTQCS